MFYSFLKQSRFPTSYNMIIAVPIYGYRTVSSR